MAKRVLVLSSVHPIGHPRFGNKIVKTLGEAGYNVEVWARNAGTLDVPENVDLRLLPPAGKLTRLLDLPTMLGRILSGNHDLIVVVPPETVPLGLFARALGKKVLWDVEEDAYGAIRHSDWIPASIRDAVAKVYDVFERLAAQFLSGISMAEDSYQGRFHHAKHAIVTHNYPPRPAEGSEDLSRGATAEARWALPGPRLIYIGTMTEARGLLDTIHMVKALEKRLPGIQLDVLGDIPRPGFRAKVEAAIETLDNKDRVTLHDRVPFEKLNDYMRNAHIGLLPLHETPNFRNSEPTKVFEYSLAGLPMVVGDRPAWRRIVDATDVGEVAKPRAINEWADAIERLWARGPETLRQNGKTVHDHIYEQNYFWNEEAKKLISLCEELMN